MLRSRGDREDDSLEAVDVPPSPWTPLEASGSHPPPVSGAATSLPHAEGPARWWEAVPHRPAMPRLEDLPSNLPSADAPPAIEAPTAVSLLVPWRRRTVFAVLAAVALGGGITGSVLTRVIGGPERDANAGAVGTASDATRRPSPTPPRSTLAPSGGQPRVFNGFGNSVADVVADVAPAVVSIQVESAAGSGAGTGIILTADGEILTNAHVVEGATLVRVLLAGESQPRPAEIIGTDPVADLALLSLPDASGLPIAELGRSADVAVGDDVVAIGNALGLRGGPTVTRGIVSALDRTLETASGTMTGLLQTDASISSGNSGGPLVDVDGEVIGINTAVAATGRGASAENVGFAIAIDQAIPVVERLRGNTVAGPVPRLGVSATDPLDGSRGATVAEIVPGSPAQVAGLQVGDLVTSVGGRGVDGAAALAGAVQARRPGEKIEVVVVRGGRELVLSATLDARD